MTVSATADQVDIFIDAMCFWVGGLSHFPPGFVQHDHPVNLNQSQPTFNT